MRQHLFAAVLFIAACLFDTGVALLSVPAAFLVGAVLLAAWAWLVLTEPDTAGIDGPDPDAL